MADGPERVKDKLSAVTGKAKKALANLESSVKGDGVKKERAQSEYCLTLLEHI